MRRPVTPTLGRRSLILGAASLLSGPRAPLVLGTSALAAAPAKVLTPAQTFGPFYPVEWTGDADNDLVQVTGEDRSALGTIMHISGRVLDVGGIAIAGAAIEIWQCDGHGIYRHPRDTGFFRKNDQAFQGRGRCVSDSSGGYSFRTIRPVAYPGRTPHVHFKIDLPGGGGLVTQMYVLGDPGNDQDAILNGIRDAAQRASVIVGLQPAGDQEQGALAGVFDIVLG